MSARHRALRSSIRQPARRWRLGPGTPTITAEALWGIVHLLDALQDDAAKAGRWRFPGESAVAGAAEPTTTRRYYVEDDDGHHHGPLDDYDEAAGVADGIHGQIIVQEVEQPAVSPEDEPDPEEGGA